jgi:hypothetical protein
LKLRTAPPNYYYRAPETPDFVDLFEAPTGPYFFYDTLTDPSMIREILGLQGEPELRPARISGYTCKLWGQYPALLDASDSTAEGAVYHVQTMKHGEMLAAYETSNYRADPCRIRYTDGKEPAEELGYRFKFRGDQKELTKVFLIFDFG